MPIETVINENKKQVFHIVNGILTFDEIVVAMNNLYSNPSFLTEMDILIDVLPGSTSALSSEEIHRIVEMTRLAGDARGTGRSVAIAAEEKDYGVLHVMEFLLKDEKRTLKIVRSREEAEQWLRE